MEKQDLIKLKEKGINEQQVEEQLNSFKTGFPFLKIEKAAEIGDGITKLSTEKEILLYLSKWNSYLNNNHSVVKFVPASGAASRMFKNLFEFYDATYTTPQTDFEHKFFNHIEEFAFYDDLNNVCKKNNGNDISALLSKGEYKIVIDNLLNNKGLNYGNLPKGLLKFHTYKTGSRTPLEEHLVEGVLYAKSNSMVKIHFTVSAEHRNLFEQQVSKVLSTYEKEYNIHYEISFSEQKKSTDTIAANEKNEPFRDKNGEIIFRPGGHGALIENLNDLNADIVFIKNIDNVVPDKYKETTVTYKKLIAGILVNAQNQTFEYLKKLENAETLSDSEIETIRIFCEKVLNNKQEKTADRETQISYLKEKLNRPIRVCGMVKNEGEPGGGPYLIENKDGSISPQILESSQINTKDARSLSIMKQATHFNPVDLVCGLKNYKGEKFNLLNYVDKNTGFISLKSKNGQELKALELPGLWNGAMSNWNTIFVEVPIETFNPVKTVNDLLRKEHQQ